MRGITAVMDHLVVLCLLCATTGALGLEVQKTAFFFALLQLTNKVVYMTQRPFLMVLTVWLTTEIPHLLLDMVINVPVVGRAVAASARAVRTWNLDIVSRPWIWQSCSVLVA